MQHEIYDIFPPSKRMEIDCEMLWDWSNKTMWIVLQILGDEKYMAAK